MVKSITIISYRLTGGYLGNSRAYGGGGRGDKCVGFKSWLESGCFGSLRKAKVMAKGTKTKGWYWMAKWPKFLGLETHAHWLLTVGGSELANGFVFEAVDSLLLVVSVSQGVGESGFSSIRRKRSVGGSTIYNSSYMLSKHFLLAICIL